eukprot:9667895-Ditylum_brightwellii.AAC.1
MHQTKAPSGNLVIAQEIREAKMVWLQIWAKLECLTRSSEESGLEGEEEEDKDEDMLQELLVPHMVQTIPSLLAKKEDLCPSKLICYYVYHLSADVYVCTVKQYKYK